MQFEGMRLKTIPTLEDTALILMMQNNIFNGYTLTIEDDRVDYGEQCFVSFGIMYGHVIAVAYLETEEVIRIITARKATKNEQNKYFKQVSH